ncbi:MAG: RlmF-related methyltransferase [Candidatus Heimdallarchaeota archaeon]|nr:MAG: RlmF-related methyltransferase [Candidatus Heimdallarchaeota archaeon]
MIPLFSPEKPCGLPFKEAFTRYPALRKYAINGDQIDLGNSQALLLYNRLVLQDFMGLDFTVPPGYLIPTICSRWEFVCWIIHEKIPSKVLEVGTGASAILSMMLAKLGCHVKATELDEVAYQSARNNIKENNFESQILLIKVRDTNSILKGYFDSLATFDAIICNPPQYDLSYFHKKSLIKGFAGQKLELVGGEEGDEFILRLIEEIRSFEAPLKVYFQLTLPKLHKNLTEYLQNQGYSFLKDHRTLGTRQRYYFRVDY